jgi:hypothetical protein
MNNQEQTPPEAPARDELNLAQIIQEAMQKAYAQRDPETSGLRNELSQERRKREQLEKRLNELVEENRQSKQLAEQAERFAAIKSQLQQLGVAKVDLAFRAVKDDINRGEDGRLYVRGEDGSPIAMQEYLTQWVAANPEFKPARIAGGSGASQARSAPAASHFELERIRPGMSAEERERARNEVARVAAQTLAGNG